jgi:SAM-dependent methyltransferase
MAYQTFDTPGDSDSPAKLAALQLHRLPIEGGTVLDIGCNAGFFCEAAVASGASVVTGIDTNTELITQARQRAPVGVSYSARSWDDVPDGPWDVILLLSAIHYERDQVGLLRRIRKQLKRGGTLVLECGVAPIGGQQWQRCTRPGNSTVRFPSMELLQSMLDEAGLTCRWMGRSVDQRGDAIPRHVFHCSPKQPTLLLVCGPGMAGKSTLCRSLGGVRFSVDDFVRSTGQTENSTWARQSQRSGLRELFPFYEWLDSPAGGGVVLDEFIASMFDCLPDTDTVVVDCIDRLTPAIRDEAIKRGFKVWTATTGGTQ